MKSPEGTILYANEAFAQLANRPLQRIIGASWLELFPPTEQHRLKALTANDDQPGVRSEFELLTGAAAPRPVQISFRSMKPAGVLGFSVIVTDLLERNAAETALRQANESLEFRVQSRTTELTTANQQARDEIVKREEAQAALHAAKEDLARANTRLEQLVEERTAKLREMVSELQQLSYAIVHDMRAPLRAMQGFATVIHDDPSLSPAEITIHSRRIINAAKRLDQLTRDVLTYNQAVLADLPLLPVDLARLLPGLVESYPNLHPDLADIRLEGKLPVVLGNEALLTQCFSNLLGNAVKFVKPGTRPRVRVWAETVAGAELAKRKEKAPAAYRPQFELEGTSLTIEAPHAFGPAGPLSSSMVRIWVEDNGIGIPDQSRRRLFGMFQRLNNEYEGTGVGLAIVRKVVERMGGQVGLESNEGDGSRFWVELPVANNQDPAHSP